DLLSWRLKPMFLLSLTPIPMPPRKWAINSIWHRNSPTMPVTPGPFALLNESGLKLICDRRIMILRARERTIRFPRRPLIMGIVNINDDSLSGDGTLDVDRAIELARAQVISGADIIDVGGESARTNRREIPEQIEIERVLPFVRRFAECYDGLGPV